MADEERESHVLAGTGPLKQHGSAQVTRGTNRKITDPTARELEAETIVPFGPKESRLDQESAVAVGSDLSEAKRSMKATGDYPLLLE